MLAKKVFVHALFSVTAVGFSLPGGAYAAHLSINDMMPNQITVGANDWEYGLTVNGNPFQIGLFSPNVQAFAGEGPMTFDGYWYDLGLTQPLTRTVYFVEPGNPWVISDIFTYSVQTVQPLEESLSGGIGHFLATFTSSPDGGDLGMLPDGVGKEDVIIEGQVFYFGAPYFGGEILTPEPASLALLGLGGLAMIRRRR